MKLKREHEFRDPIHEFIKLDRQERMLVDSEPFQRLRAIHQLALTYLVYPGASHNRFEHSLGVMHLAGIVFDIVTAPENILPAIEHIIPDRKNLPYWRTVLCLAALCHDLGHLPFSHAAEKQLLPEGEDHESLTLDLISSSHFDDIWKTGFRVHLDDVRKLAVGKKKLKSESFDDWEAILSEIITGDAFGVDRIDYLLRDSYHCGVTYGKFDHLKLINSLRILPKSVEEGQSREPALGVEIGGLHSAEALLLARYFMYQQVYFHPVRRIYDIHLIDFMKSHYGMGGYKRDVDFHLAQTDHEIAAAMRSASREPESVGYASANAILKRGHFRPVYHRNPTDEEVLRSSVSAGALAPIIDKPFTAGSFIYEELVKDFGNESLRTDTYTQKSNPNYFPILMPDGRVEDSVRVSAVLANIPLTTVDYIFASRETAADVLGWIDAKRATILKGVVS